VNFVQTALCYGIDLVIRMGAVVASWVVGGLISAMSIFDNFLVHSFRNLELCT
jgi:hypothetical protein